VLAVTKKNKSNFFLLTYKSIIICDKTYGHVRDCRDRMVVGFATTVKRHIQQYFSHIVAISFNGGGNQSTLRTATSH
jgi:hypothetical protein